MEEISSLNLLKMELLKLNFREAAQVARVL
jgi:hypothetical protein